MRFGIGYDAWMGGGRGGHEHGHGRMGLHGERGRPEGRGRRRMFDGGELKLVLLRLIAAEPRHGYDLIREIEAMTGGAYAPSPGIIYPNLTLLGEMGLIEEQAAEGAKKRFAITEAGTAYLADNATLVEQLLSRLAEVSAVRAQTDGAPIRRAMGNLKAVLQHRLSADGVTAETLHAVAGLIDEAAQKIERL